MAGLLIEMRAPTPSPIPYLFWDTPNFPRDLATHLPPQVQNPYPLLRQISWGLHPPTSCQALDLPKIPVPQGMRNGQAKEWLTAWVVL